MEAEQGLARAPKTVAEPAQALRNAAVSVFFRGSYRKVLATVIAAGATLQEAEDAVSDAMQAVLQAWGRIESPLAYARRAALRRFYKVRIRSRTHEQVSLDLLPDDNGSTDPTLTVWEDGQYVTQLLESLPHAQREAMALAVDEFSPIEISLLLGTSDDAVRQRLHVARKRLKPLTDIDGASNEPTQPKEGM